MIKELRLRPRPRPFKKGDTVPIRHYKKGENIFTGSHVLQALGILCFNTAYDQAQDTTTRAEIEANARALRDKLEARGPDYCRLLLAEAISESFHAFEFGTTRIRTFPRIMADFEEWWKANPRKHHMHVLAEMLP